MTEYMELYKAVSSSVCPKTLGLRQVDKSTLEKRIRDLMDVATRESNRELAQVACDITADELGTGNLLHEMDQQIRTIKTSVPEHEQIYQARTMLNIQRRPQAISSGVRYHTSWLFPLLPNPITYVQTTDDQCIFVKNGNRSFSLERSKVTPELVPKGFLGLILGSGTLTINSGGRSYIVERVIRGRALRKALEV